jgi:hypothetical protein
MMENDKKPISQKISLFNDNSPSKSKTKKGRKSYSVNNLSLIKAPKIKPQQLIFNVIDFIKQKNKFFIENSFDSKGTREFLASKEVAMRVIKLDDEIRPEKNRRKSKTNKNLFFMKENENENNIKKSVKPSHKNTMSPRKTRKSHNKKMNKEFNLEIKEMTAKKSKKMKRNSKKTKDRIALVECENDSSELDSNSNSTNKKNNIIFDKLSDDSHSKIYKFFIDNANEPDENFQKKLQKELKKVENLKHNKEKDKEKEKKAKDKRKSISRKDIHLKRPKRMNSVIVAKPRETQSIFMFSEINKKLMVNDDLELSSIDENNKNIQSPTNNKVNKKNINKNYASIQMNNKKIKERIQERMSYDSKEEKENIYKTTSKLEINSDKESIISILSDLM